MCLADDLTCSVERADGGKVAYTGYGGRGRFPWMRILSLILACTAAIVLIYETLRRVVRGVCMTSSRRYALGGEGERKVLDGVVLHNMRLPFCLLLIRKMVDG
jgi:hypothetical protein